MALLPIRARADCCSIPSTALLILKPKYYGVLQNYAFLEEPVRLIRAIRLSARFHWPLENGPSAVLCEEEQLHREYRQARHRLRAGAAHA